MHMQIHTEELVRRVASLTNQDRTSVSAVVAALADEIVAALDEGDTVTWRKFGIFKMRRIAPRAGGLVRLRRASLKSYRSIHFVECKELRNNINFYEPFIRDPVQNPQDQSRQDQGDGGTQ